MSTKKIIALVAVAVVFAGAGCADKKESKGSEDEVTGLSLPVETIVASSPTTSSQTVVSATADATWQTYTSRDGSWKFLWPTKGSMAPRWEADIASETKDGCYGEGEQRRVKLGDAEFCHTGTREGGTATDYYVTKRGEQHVRLTFTKQGGDKFDWAAYAAFLDQVVGTFQNIIK